MTDTLNLQAVRERLAERLAKGEYEEMLADVLVLLDKLGRRTASLEFELMRLRKSTKGRKSEKLNSQQLDLLLSLVAETDRGPTDANATRDHFDDRLDGELDGCTDEELERAAQEEGEAAQAEDQGAQTEDNDGPKKKRRGRRLPPDHLPVEKRIIDPKLTDYEGREMVCIGSVEAHTLDWRPGHFIHVHTERRKYAPRDGDGPVVIAEPPTQVIVRGLAEPGLLAHVIVSKYADHLPLHRLVKIFKREGVEVAVSTMVGWLRQCTKLLAPLVTVLGQEVRLSCSFSGSLMG